MHKSKKNTIFVIPFTLPWDWSADYQRQTCFVLTRRGNVVAYMQKDAVFFLRAMFAAPKHYPKLSKIRFYRPLYFVPFRRVDFIEKLNQLMSYLLFEIFRVPQSKQVLWIFDPEFYFLSKVARGVSLYDCIDYAWDREEKLAMKIQSQEQKLIKRVHLFFVNSTILAKLHSSVRTPTAIVPQGFANPKLPIIRSSSPPRRPVLGYVGAIDHRIDFPLLHSLIIANPRWDFILWGPIQEIEKSDRKMVLKQVQLLRQYRNCFIGKSKMREGVFSQISRFHIGLIPYRISLDSVRYAYPMKLFEYFYMGKPVVSTPIEELKRFPKFVKIGSSAEEWEKHINRLLSKPWPSSYKKEQRRLAIKNSWKKKIASIISEIDRFSSS